MTAEVLYGDCLEVLPTLESDGFDSVVTDPPYSLGFMGKDWDSTGVAFQPETWEAVLRVLKPSGYMLAFGGTRTCHRLACAIEDAGFEIRDCLMWVYGSGFPKGKGCLKPAWEPIILARKPGKKVLPLGIDACRIPCDDKAMFPMGVVSSTEAIYGNGHGRYANRPRPADGNTTGRWPANLTHDGSEEVLEAFAAFGGRGAHAYYEHGGHEQNANGNQVYGNGLASKTPNGVCPHDTGTAARFFYCAKASKQDRDEGNAHPTVKPTTLMRWLCRLITPPAGKILDPFAGSGSTGKAAVLEGFRFVGIEREAAYVEIARKRIAAAQAELPLFAEGAK